ncbi:hypothetical protein LY90DRAFT_511466 [Neocallimastix californiae]|uniref:Uncharacterized protein n=1 Tax=Neocallimastix californiae TaxID=1754190 RepID=A0A1Y2BP90_9FUNG|nr:hypothetical protein LY90DRAFT_511466 [Neocallimastix californiae]|eukprot:ORY36570.1 hypothetical protein LY90DRAFT_511466 [Neocallimastix californiae]
MEVKFILFIYIVFYFGWFHSIYGKFYTKDEILKLKGESSYNTEFYCKDDVCVSKEDDYAEFPDGNGNVTRYITKACHYDSLVKDECYSSKKCTIDSECLSNKCLNSTCIFNEENPIVYCTNEYSFNAFLNRRKSIMHCGKAPMDSCTEKKDCGSNVCVESYCGYGGGGPSDSETAGSIYGLVWLGIGFVVFIVLIVICCCCIKKHKKGNNTDV